MSDFVAGLALIWDFLLTVFTSVFNLYTSYPVLMAALTLWVLDRVFGIFKLIRG